MDAKQYIQNQLILENCEKYLELLEFLPEQEEVWDVVNNYKPEFLQATQNFETTKNQTMISFHITSFLDNNEKQSSVSNFKMKVVLRRNELASITFTADVTSELNRTVYFMNNCKIVKVVDSFVENEWNQKRISYYADEELINSCLYYMDPCADRFQLENKMFMENLYIEDGYHYNEIYNERDYINGTCISRKHYGDTTTLSHNQFEKRYKGSLKRIRKLGQNY